MLLCTKGFGKKMMLYCTIVNNKKEKSGNVTKQNELHRIMLICNVFTPIDKIDPTLTQLTTIGASS